MIESYLNYFLCLIIVQKKEDFSELYYATVVAIQFLLTQDVLIDILADLIQFNSQYFFILGYKLQMLEQIQVFIIQVLFPYLFSFIRLGLFQ